MNYDLHRLLHHSLRASHFLLVLIFLAHVLRQRKSPASTMAWLMVVLIFPYIGFPLYLMLGTRKFLPTKPLLFARLSTPSALLQDPVQRTLTTSGSPLPCLTNKIDLLETGEAAFSRIVELIDSASKRIYLETYIFSGDQVGRAVLERLTAAAHRGVEVRLLIDAIGAHLPGTPCLRGFKLAGGKTAFFMPLFHRPFRGAMNLRNHRKQMIIDGSTVVLGGMNIAEEYMGPTFRKERWKDLAISVEGTAATHYEEVFVADWAYARGLTQNREPLSSASLLNSGNHLSQLVVSGPDVKTDPIYEMLLTAIFNARHRVWIATPYFVPDDALAKALELAARRGIDVRLQMPQKSNHLLADFGRNTYVQQVQSAGTKIYLFPRMLHAKATLIDQDYALLGSANTDVRSLLLNYELGICLYTKSEIQQIESWFENTFAESKQGFPTPNLLQTITGNLARMLAPLM